MLKKRIYILLLFLTGASMAAAQTLSPTVVASAGGFGSSGNVSLSWTAGELVSKNLSVDTLMLTQGFQQSQLTVTTSVNEFNALTTDVKVYPNPADNVLNVDFQGMADQILQLKLMSLNGKVVMTRKIHNPKGNTRLNINGASPGTYMLEISLNGKSKIFKIVKQ